MKKTVNRRGNGAIRLTEFHIENGQDVVVRTLQNGGEASFVFSYECPSPNDIRTFDIGFSLEKDGHLVSVVYSSHTKEQFSNIQLLGNVRFKIEKLPLAPGMYHIGARVLANGLEADWPKGSIGSFEVLPSENAVSNGYQTDPMSVLVFDGHWSQGQVR